MDVHGNDVMAEFKSAFMERGRVKGDVNFMDCWDVEGLSSERKIAMNMIRTLGKRVCLLRTQLDQIMPTDKLSELGSELGNLEVNEMLKREEEIELKYRPIEITYNERALINKTQCLIPEDVRIALSFGWKFLFPYTTTSDNLHCVLAQIDCFIEQSVDPLSQHEAFDRVAHILAKRDNFVHDNIKKWLKFIGNRTERFFKKQWRHFCHKIG